MNPEPKKQITLSKGAHIFLFRYHEIELESLAQCLIAKASDKNSGLDWFDAEVLCNLAGIKTPLEVGKMLRKPP